MLLYKFYKISENVDFNHLNFIKLFPIYSPISFYIISFTVSSHLFFIFPLSGSPIGDDGSAVGGSAAMEKMATLEGNSLFFLHKIFLSSSVLFIFFDAANLLDNFDTRYSLKWLYNYDSYSTSSLRFQKM